MFLNGFESFSKNSIKSIIKSFVIFVKTFANEKFKLSNSQSFFNSQTKVQYLELLLNPICSLDELKLL